MNRLDEKQPLQKNERCGYTPHVAVNHLLQDYSGIKNCRGQRLGQEQSLKGQRRSFTAQYPGKKD
jgi:hypothetical protein